MLRNSRTGHIATAFVAISCLSVTAAGEPAAAGAQQHLVPQSLQIAHKEALEQITILSGRQNPVGAAAAKVLALYKEHSKREDEFIFPPLTLLPLLADGKVTPDMAWALPMTDRVKAEQEQIFVEHTAITEALNELVEAGVAANDTDAKEFAEAAVADSLTDLEILVPTVIFIGDVLHSKLPVNH